MEVAGFAAVGNSAVVATPEGLLYLLSSDNINAPSFTDLKSSVFAPVASANDTVYIHTWAPERLYAMDTTGKQRWNPLELLKK